MLILYWRPTCPYCHKVLDAAQALGLVFEKRDIAVPTIAVELIQRGGKRQVPYLVDTDRMVELYESMDIIAYLQKYYPKT
jgi:glutaredoxin 3